MTMGATAQIKLQETVNDLERLTRIAERRTCIIAVLAEARDYRARAVALGSALEFDKAHEMDAIAAALDKLANVMEGRS
jgi:hypothetical protein